MMSGLCDEQDMHDNIYTNTYSLWGNSKYYDIKNLSPQNFANRNGTIGSEISREFKASRWSTSPTEVQVVEEPPDFRKRRTVNRESLFEDPDTFHKAPTEESPSKSPTFDWTQFYWHKATEKYQESALDCAPGPSRNRKVQAVEPNRIQKNLEKMLDAKPVKMTIAESMMQKMGWQGGALGRSGDGIMEPISPNAVYAKTKIGFGQNHILIPPKTKKPDRKHFFDMNVLLNIYQFIMNNNEVELLFDRKLRKDERKQIHQLVQFKLKAEDLDMREFGSSPLMDLVLQITDRNCYILQTQSSGVHPYRQLCLFKEAPPHVYLIIPDDLREDETSEEILETKNQSELEEVLKIEINEEPQKTTEELEMEEETNPFLISITRNLKKVKSDSESHEEIPNVPEEPVVPEKPVIPEKTVAVDGSLPEQSKIMTSIVEFFTEFAESKKYTQLKFLGPFTEEEILVINDFIEQALKFLNGVDCPLEKVFKKLAFKVNEDCTGNTVIYKKPV